MVKLTHVAPVLIVDRVEPCVKFWVDRFAFMVENEVPGPDGLVFASVKKDGIELMYQTRASVVAEAPGTEKDLDGHSIALFFTVDDIGGVERAIPARRWSSRGTRRSMGRQRSTCASRGATRWALRSSPKSDPPARRRMGRSA